MPVVYGVHNNSDLFISVGILDASNPLPAVPGAFLPNPPMFNALIDTGAQATMISPNVINVLGLRPLGKILIAGVDPGGPHYHNGYLFHVAFVFPAGPATPVPGGVAMRTLIQVNKNVIYGAEITTTGGRFDVLLGMDIISGSTLTVCGNGTYVFAM